MCDQWKCFFFLVPSKYNLFIHRIYTKLKNLITLQFYMTLLETYTTMHDGIIMQAISTLCTYACCLLL